MANETHEVVAIHLPAVWVHGGLMYTGTQRLPWVGMSGEERKNGGKKAYPSFLFFSQFVNKGGGNLEMLRASLKKNRKFSFNDA